MIQTNKTAAKRLVRPLCLCAVLAAALSLPCAEGQPVLVDDPFNLPPTNGAGWYSAPGLSVSFYAEYETNEGPPGSTQTGILARAHSIIVDNFRGITNWHDGNDQVLRFGANLTAALSELSGRPLDPAQVVTLGGNMQVRLVGRLGRATGTFPLAVESLSFTMFVSDLGGSATNALLNIRAAASPISGGELSVARLDDGKYEVTSTLDVYSEAAAYRTDHWLPHWPDTNGPTAYALLSLQPPPASISVGTNGSLAAVAGQFQMRRNVRYVFAHSPDFQAWSSISTNYTAGCGLGEVFKFVEPATNSMGLYRARTTLIPMP